MSLIVLSCRCCFRFSLFFFFNDTATTEIYTLSLHDALPICIYPGQAWLHIRRESLGMRVCAHDVIDHRGRRPSSTRRQNRSEEHTSELQSPCNLVCRLLLDKKNETDNMY